MKTILCLALMLSALSAQAQLNSNWGFVGPFSENLQNGNLFESSRMNTIIGNPGDPTFNHLIGAGVFAGLWECTNATAPSNSVMWNNISTIHIGSNGVSAVAFRNATEIIVANYFAVSSGDTWSTGVFKYNLVTHVWTDLGELTTDAITYRINRIVFYPGSEDRLFVCTSIGLFISDDGGSTWAQREAGRNINTIAFLPYPAGSEYAYVISGTSTPVTASSLEGRKWKGRALLKLSFDQGATFTDVGPFQTTIDAAFPALDGANEEMYIYMNSTLCLGARGAGDAQDLYVYTAMADNDGFGSSEEPRGVLKNSAWYVVHKLKWNGSSITTCVQRYRYNDGQCTPDRLVIAFENNNAVGTLWFGGIALNSHPAAGGIGPTDTYRHPSAKDEDGQVHDDIHDIALYGRRIFVATDGGIYLGDLTAPSHGFFEYANNGLNVCLINGFAGASQDPNYYVLGCQDIVYTDFYDATAKKSIYSHLTWENDGAVFDAINNNIVVADESSYDAMYWVSTNRGESFTTTEPVPSSESMEFGTPGYFHDPYRSRMFRGVKGPKLTRFNYTTNRLEETVYFHDCPYWFVDPFKRRPDDWWQLMLVGMSFSREDPNSIHLITNSHSLVPDGGLIIKYIGLDFDAALPPNSYEYTLDGVVKRQWELITPDWVDRLNFRRPWSVNEVATAAERKSFNYTGIVTSPVDPDVIYVSCGRVPGNDHVRILKYNGQSWDDYSHGIPLGEMATAITIDPYSNDGIYLATIKGIYYRDATMPAFVPYNNGWPIPIVRQMETNGIDQTVRAGTFGRGIWKSPLRCPETGTVNESGTYTSNRIVEQETINSVATTGNARVVVYKGGSEVNLLPGFESSPDGLFDAFIQPCVSPATVSVEEKGSEEVGSRPHQYRSAVFPNPNSGTFRVEFDIPAGETGVFTLFDLSGRRIAKIPLAGGDRRVTIDDSRLKDGVYLYEITVGAQVIGKDRIVIQR